MTLNLNKEIDIRKLKEFLNKDISRKSARRKPVEHKLGGRLLIGLAVSFLVCGFLWGSLHGPSLYSQVKEGLFRLGFLTAEEESFVDKDKAESEYVSPASHEQAVISAVKQASPAVVSIVVTKEMPVYETYYEQQFEEFFGEGFGIQFDVPKYRQKGTEQQEIGGGTGFIVSTDGMVLTNKHVVQDEDADFTVITNEGRKYSAKVLDRDPFEDLAILKIEQETEIDEQGVLIVDNFPVLKLGNSDALQIGQSVIAIGNALGEFRNTVSVGIVSGLGRDITASGNGISEVLEDVIQTDAAINRGNSGGPLLNLKGEVIGISVAMAESAQSIGFAILVNKAKRDITQVQRQGKITYPFLGIWYKKITAEAQEELDLPVDYGALVAKSDNVDEPAVFPDSAADKAGLQEGDIILEFDGEKVTAKNYLGKLIQEHFPSDQVVLKVLREGQYLMINVILGERTVD